MMRMALESDKRFRVAGEVSGRIEAVDLSDDVDAVIVDQHHDIGELQRRFPDVAFVMSSLPPGADDLAIAETALSVANTVALVMNARNVDLS